MSKFEPKPFGKYYLTDCIAIGGMAEIYKAKTFGVDGFEKVLAIKKILSHYSADKDFITMLTDEAKLVVNLSHANIVQVYDLGRVGDDYFISMEYIDGIDLRELLERAKKLGKPIPEDICIYILSEVCRGLDYAHNKKDASDSPLQIVHRDVSPQNILVSYEGGVKIVDFGIAKAAMNLSQTNIGTLKGKVTYMAPEQAFGKPIDGRTDLYSAGIVLYELLTQERLFVGESQMEVLKKIRNTHITADSINPKVPQKLRAMIAKALAYHVKDRFQSAADMQIDLTRALYKHYPEFTPRKLVEFLKQWFLSTSTKPKDNTHNENPDKETILVSASSDEVNPVHHEESNQAESHKSDFNHTINSGYELNQDMFWDDSDEDKEENTEKTEKSNHSEEILLHRQRSHILRKVILGIVFAVTLIALWFTKDIVMAPDPDPQTPIQTQRIQMPQTVTPDKPVTHVLTTRTSPDEALGLRAQSPTQLDFNVKPEPVIVRSISVKITSNVSNAAVSINGSIKGKTPLTVNLPMGTHRILVSKKDHTTASKSITLNSNQRSSELYLKITPKSTPAAAPTPTSHPVTPSIVPTASNTSSTGQLRVDSTPRGASVKINGAPKGVTPIVVGSLPKNTPLSVTVSKSGFKSWSTSVTLNRDKTEIKANLSP